MNQEDVKNLAFENQIGWKKETAKFLAIGVATGLAAYAIEPGVLKPILGALSFVSTVATITSNYMLMKNWDIIEEMRAIKNPEPARVAVLGEAAKNLTTESRIGNIMESIKSIRTKAEEVRTEPQFKV